ncbi:MAG: hypothetical protein OXC06_05850 [Acidimicrobiaceae bacterium]|nr:hypothetical protein [Acidimicrobiaceae bacterium]
MSPTVHRGAERGLVVLGSRCWGRARLGVARRGERGLASLEWLLIFAAAAGVAGLSTVTVQRVLDDTSEVPGDPAVRLIDADIEAAFVAHEAQAVFDQAVADAKPADYSSRNADFQSRCNALKGDFRDVVASADWDNPAGTDDRPGTPDDVPARCKVTPLTGLGG